MCLYKTVQRIVISVACIVRNRISFPRYFVVTDAFNCAVTLRSFVTAEFSQFFMLRLNVITCWRELLESKRNHTLPKYP